jgi:hypothetical protein
MLGRLQAQAGTVYYASQASLCAVDAAGIRKVGSSIGDDGLIWGFIEAFWLDGERLLFTDGHALYAVPRTGGERTTLVTLPFSFYASYAYDGTYLYWGSGYGDANIYRVALAGGEPQTLTTAAGNGLESIRVSGGRLDYLPISAGSVGGPLVRMQLATGATESIDISTMGHLLASIGELTYVEYATKPLPSGTFDDMAFALGVIGPSGTVAPAWSGHVPHFLPMVATVYGDTLYSGGRLHYHDGAVFLGVTALPVGSDHGSVLGCSPTHQTAGTEWAVVAAVAADEGYVYAIVSRTSATEATQVAIARFARM